MKKLPLLSLFLLLGVRAQTQPAWFLPGAEWTYEMYFGWMASPPGLYRLVVHDEVIRDGEPWVRLRRYYSDPGQPGNSVFYYARQEGGKVFSWDGPGASTCIYDFSLRPGDTLFFTSWRYYAVLDTGSVFMAGQTRRTQTIAHSDPAYPPLLLLVEGIGPTGNPNDPHNQFACSFLFLHDYYCHVQTDGTTAYFRCFADPDGAVYAPFGTCLVNTGTADVPAPVHVWPNPAGDRLFVRGDCQSLLLYDACGRALLEQKIRAGDTVEIPVTQLPDGAYFLVCRLENGKTYVHKTVLSR